MMVSHGVAKVETDGQLAKVLHDLYNQGKLYLVNRRLTIISRSKSVYRTRAH